MQIPSYLGQCATSTVSTAQVEWSLHNFYKWRKMTQRFTHVSWRVYSLCLKNTGLVYLPIRSLSSAPSGHLQWNVSSSFLLLVESNPLPLVFGEVIVQLSIFVRFLTPCPECRRGGEARASLTDCGWSVKTSSVRLQRRR